jgi:hypothetical protein
MRVIPLTHALKVLIRLAFPRESAYKPHHSACSSSRHERTAMLQDGQRPLGKIVEVPTQDQAAVRLNVGERTVRLIAA